MADQPLFDSEAIAKDLIESNDHVDWSMLPDGVLGPINAVLGSAVSDDTGMAKRPHDLSRDDG